MKLVSSKDILTSASPTMMTSNANSESSTVPNPTMTHLHPMSITSLSFVQSDTPDTVLETMDDEEVLEEGNEEEETNKVFQIVAFDMDEIIIDEEDYYRWY